MNEDDAKTVINKINRYKTLLENSNVLSESIRDMLNRRTELESILLSASSEAWNRPGTKSFLEHCEGEYMDLDETILSLNESEEMVSKERREIYNELVKMGFKRVGFGGEIHWIPNTKNTFSLIVLYIKEKINSVWK